MTNETKYVVVSESDLNMLISEMGRPCVNIQSIPAKELWDAAQTSQWQSEWSMKITHPTVTDFLTSKFPSND